MRTIGASLDESRGLGQGFDFLRVFLAFGVVAWHTPEISIGSDALQSMRFFWFGNYAILFMFFALSGFLIAGSAQRLSLWNFIVNRGLRIVPALGVEIVLSAFILGPIFTSLSPGQYFSNFGTYHYLTNIVGRINFHLPGVFDSAPSDYVNASLWTVPSEIFCYVIMGGLIVFGLLRRPWSIVALYVAILAIGMAMVLGGYDGVSVGYLQHAADRLFYNRGSGLVLSFLLGIAAYLYRYRIAASWWLFAAAAGLCLVVAGLGTRQYPQPPVALLTTAALTYITVFLGVCRIPKLPLFHRGDYSYGIYLYGWPVMQAMRAWFPGAGAVPVLLWLVSFPAITAFAMFSWHAIEKPILRLRRKFSFVARQRLAEPTPARHPEPAAGRALPVE